MNVLKKISDAIPTPGKALAIGISLTVIVVFTSIATLSCTRSAAVPPAESAEAIPQDWHPVTLAQQQNRLHENTFVNNDFDTPEQLALAFKNNMMRGEGVRIETQIDVLLSRCGMIVGKATVTDVERNDGIWALEWNRGSATATNGPFTIRIPNTPHSTQKRMFDIISEDGTVRKVDHGTRQL